jgi:hypothetical protein
MGLFDFFKTWKANDFRGSTIEIHLSKPNRTVLAECQIGDYVNLWTKPEMDRVIIYSPYSIGGSEQLGTVPSKYFRAIKNHILQQRDFGFSGPSMNNYDATIVNITPSSCIISIQLFSQEEHERRISEMIEGDKKAIRSELEKKYRMTKPVDIRFDLKGNATSDLGNIRLKIFDKEYYIEHPYEYKLQLVNDSNLVIAETSSQKDKVFRVVKAHLNGHPIRIEKIEKFKDHLMVVIWG